MKLTFCGANQEVTGSCYHIETETGNVAVDCGMFQGDKYAADKNREPFPFDPAKVTSLVLTHAHFDHTGRLPKLYKEGFRGKIYTTAASADLSMITLRDAAKLMGEEAERHDHEPLYGADDVEPLQDLWAPVEYHRETEVAPGISAYLTDAGHILGSASIKFNIHGTSIAFSGDLGNTPVPLLHSTECLRESQIVVIESTYGNRVHEPASQRPLILKQAIEEAVKNRGVLLIPAFALERTQELLFELHQLLESRQIPKVPIFLDSPMAIAATEVFRAHSDLFNGEAQAMLKRFDLFHFPGLQFTERSAQSKAILDVKGPKVIIAGSGMMNGGRILHHLRNYLGKENTSVLIIGFQVEGSLGRQLHDGEKLVRIFGHEVPVRAQIKSFGSFSGHADYPRLMNWLHCFHDQPPRRVYVTHGELNAALSFSQAVEDQLGIASGVPSYGQSVDLRH